MQTWQVTQASKAGGKVKEKCVRDLGFMWNWSSWISAET
jgi:hypothetical protein